MEVIVSSIASLGVPGLVLFVAISATGLHGAAALTKALAALGPYGMIGGIATLGVIGLISEKSSELGVKAIFKAVVDQLCKDGETRESILDKIDHMPIFSGLRQQLHKRVEDYFSATA